MSISIKIYNQEAESIGELKLADKVFGVKASEALVHQAICAQMGNERQVLAHTKDRSEVRGGGKKPWRQKGTGRARAGSSRSPIWIGGGVTFGPRKDRNFKKDINRKMKQKAMLIVLSDRVRNNNLAVLDKLEIAEFKTKAFDAILEKLEGRLASKTARRSEDKEQKNKKTKKQRRSILIINDKKDDKAKYSGRNLAGVKIINLNNINILDLLKYRNVVLTKAGAKKIEERYK